MVVVKVYTQQHKLRAIVSIRALMVLSNRKPSEMIVARGLVSSETVPQLLLLTYTFGIEGFMADILFSATSNSVSFTSFFIRMPATKKPARWLANLAAINHGTQFY